MTKEMAENEVEMVPCRSCEGGRFIAACCNGAGGCDCRGQDIDMGPCNVCHGSGEHLVDADPRANLRRIEGMCFLGAGPSSGYWGSHGSRGYIPLEGKRRG